jgi:hypothetical protein
VSGFSRQHATGFPKWSDLSASCRAMRNGSAMKQNVFRQSDVLYLASGFPRLHVAPLRV